jgi:DNA-binding NtrC family response regulator
MNASILFVDDDYGVTNFLSRLFRKSQYCTLTASNALQGLAMVENFRFSVIVSDQQMPGMSGLEFLNKAHAIQPEAIKVIFSGSADVVERHDGERNPVVAEYILKPCFDDELIQHINTLLSGRR